MTTSAAPPTCASTQRRSSQRSIRFTSSWELRLGSAGHYCHYVPAHLAAHCAAAEPEGELKSASFGKSLVCVLELRGVVPELCFGKVGTLLLICTFFFDIFWVFISPVIFKKSVMIEAGHARSCKHPPLSCHVGVRSRKVMRAYS